MAIQLPMLLLMAFLLDGCAAVYPQPAPIRPVAVYVADYGIHSSLLMPVGDGRFVEYAFGDWNFAALNHCWPNDALGALLISFQSALGRRFITLKPGQTAPCPADPPPHHLQVVYASADEVRQVVEQMDARFRRHVGPMLHNSDNQMDFVMDSEHYSVLNNCNHLTARCLREMGCKVQGMVVLSNFQVEEPPEMAAMIARQVMPRKVEPPLRTAVRAFPATAPTASAN